MSINNIAISKVFLRDSSYFLEFGVADFFGIDLLKLRKVIKKNKQKFHSSFELTKEEWKILIKEKEFSFFRLIYDESDVPFAFHTLDIEVLKKILKKEIRRKEIILYFCLIIPFLAFYIWILLTTNKETQLILSILSALGAVICYSMIHCWAAIHYRNL